jgi:phosphoglucosamine mutase
VTAARRQQIPLSSTRIFGTDGIRGRAGDGWLELRAASAVGRAAAEVLRERLPSGSAHPRALLGHDGRRSGPELEAALARGFAAAGFRCASAGLFTTPGLATVARERGFELCAMVSASHNPAADNGIKLFGPLGEKLADEIELEIEARLHAAPRPADEGAPPALDPEFEQLYLAHLQRAAGALRLEGMNIALDCANGGGSRVAPRVFGRLGAKVSTVAAEPDGTNINAGCGAVHPELLQEQRRRSEAQVGIALDGDGDRCILVDERGAIVHGDPQLMLLARDAAQRAELDPPRIVATVMSNRGLHRALRASGIAVTTVDVGDRRVVEALRRDGLALGGEQSGHIVFGAANHYVGDGLYTALRVLRVLRESGQSLAQLAADYVPFPQVLVNVPVARKPHLRELPELSERVDALERELGEDGRVLLRYSGTEPLARVMIEGPDHAHIQARAHALAELLGRLIGT